MKNLRMVSLPINIAICIFLRSCEWFRGLFYVCIFPTINFLSAQKVVNNPGIHNWFRIDIFTPH